MAITVQKLVAGYKNTPVLQALDLRIPDNQLVAIIGPNGCGKSTLLRCIARIHQPESGMIQVNGLDIWNSGLKRVATEISLLPQHPVAPPGITVQDLAAYGRHPHQGLFCQWSERDQAAVDRALEVTDMSEFKNRPLERLSGGQRQRAWLSMAIAREAPVMLLDEPTSALDLGHQIEVLSLIRSLAQAGTTILMVVHDLFLATRYASHLIALSKGEVIAVGKPAEIVDSELVKTLYGVEVDILQTPDDDSPLVVPRTTKKIQAI